MAGAPLVLVAGGAHDPNLRALLRALEAAGVETLPLLVAPARSPALRWQLEGVAEGQADARAGGEANGGEATGGEATGGEVVGGEATGGVLWIDGRPVRPTAAFLRHDVFGRDGPGGAYRAFAWYTTVAGWLLANPQVRCANRTALTTQLNKPHVLALARAAGLAVPATLVSNEPEHIAAQLGVTDAEGARGAVVKPVTGGGYCQRLAALRDRTEVRDGAAATPCIAQPELVPPEVRIYRVGHETLAFRVVSDALDYRTSTATRVVPLEQPPDAGLVAGLARLMDRLGLQFGAADFKTDPSSGALCFLELNTAPMFSVFDRAAGGALCAALVRWLVAARR